MPRPPSPSLPEKGFVYRTLEKGLRLDGRSLLEMRQPTLTFGQDLGWVECTMGKTRYVILTRPHSLRSTDVTLFYFT